MGTLTVEQPSCFNKHFEKMFCFGFCFVLNGSFSSLHWDWLYSDAGLCSARRYWSDGCLLFTRSCRCVCVRLSDVSHPWEGKDIHGGDASWWVDVEQDSMGFDDGGRKCKAQYFVNCFLRVFSVSAFYIKEACWRLCVHWVLVLKVLDGTHHNPERLAVIRLPNQLCTFYDSCRCPGRRQTHVTDTNTVWWSHEHTQHFYCTKRLLKNVRTAQKERQRVPCRLSLHMHCSTS